MQNNKQSQRGVVISTPSRVSEPSRTSKPSRTLEPSLALTPSRASTPLVRRKLLLSAVGAITLSSFPSRWSKPLINSVITPSHAQTSNRDNLCADGISTWLMSEYQENGTAFNQGAPQSQVTITITGNNIDLVTDWFVINSSSGSTSRGRVTDSGSINLNNGVATTSPTGSPTASPTHGGVENLVNNLDQSFTLDCNNSNGFVVSDNTNIYSFRLTRVS